MLHLLFSDLLFLSDDNEQSQMLTAFKFNNQPIEGELRLRGWGWGFHRGTQTPDKQSGSSRVQGRSLGDPWAEGRVDS